MTLKEEVKKAINKMEMTTFVQFILEEACQTVGMGAFLALKEKNYTQLGSALTELKKIVSKLESVNAEIGDLAPYSDEAFKFFAQAVRKNIAIYEKVIS